MNVFELGFVAMVVFVIVAASRVLGTFFGISPWLLGFILACATVVAVFMHFRRVEQNNNRKN